MKTEHDMSGEARSRSFLTPRAAPNIPELPEPLGYRLKNKILGPPLHTEQLAHERLGKPTALAVFASDNLSSSAYATEEIIKHLVPIVGLAAFALVVPITIALLVVLGLLILSYRQTIKEYPTAGGAYVVTNDNFGPLAAQVAGVSLLMDYVLTVSVSVAAGTAALTSAVSALVPWAAVIAVGFIVIIAYGNLRGVRESGKVFAVPTYFFIVNMALLLGAGLARMLFGHLPQGTHHAEGLVHFGHASGGLIMGVGLFVVLRAFASGGAAVTGVEAISNGVSAFRIPEWKNARSTLVIMGSLLGAMFLGLSVLAAHMKVVPYESGTPTVIAQIGKLVYGGGPIGHIGFYALQVATMLILVLAANTSFADFPRLASFQAGDNFLPRQLTKRGHRLVFSNGIITLSAVSIVLVIITDAKVDRLIPLYAVGVFTSFTLSQAGMARHHLRKKEPGWRSGLVINGTGAVLSLIVDLIIAWTKFKPPGAILGAWVIVVTVPILVAILFRLNRQYEVEGKELEEDAPRAAAAPILRRHVVLVFIEELDHSSARAVQYARTLTPDELRAVHFVLDPMRADKLREDWDRVGLARVALELIDCPDRRLDRSALQTVAEYLADGDTEVTVLIPRIEYTRFWHRLLHDRSSESIAEAVGRLAHANVTFVPYHLGRPVNGMTPGEPTTKTGATEATSTVSRHPVAEGLTPIADVRHRERVRIGGRVHAVRVQPFGSAPSSVISLRDETGSISVVFLGRRRISGVETGVRMVVTGTVAEHDGRLAILNPDYELLPDAH